MAAEMHIFNDRHPGASLTALLGQRAEACFRQDYATLAEALADNCRSLSRKKWLRPWASPH